MPDSDIRNLLSGAKWNKLDVLDKLTDANCNKFIASANIVNPFANDDEPLLQKQERQKITSAICFGDLNRKVRASICK